MDRARRPRRTPVAARRTPSADALEPRTLLTTFVVTTVADAGPGSLREAIELANFSTTADVVQFNIPSSDLYQTIRPQSPEVRVLANAVTGLAAPDVFYFGNLVGETGNPTAGAGFRVDTIDLVRTRAAAPWDPPMVIISRFDHDRDGDVDGADLAIARSNFSRRLEPFADAPAISGASRRTAYRPASRVADELLG
jgi:hypothetical protein